MAKNRKTIINLASSVVVLIINIAINLWLSPFIIKNIGVEANGFISMANSFVTYANLIVTALNGMASRFITIEYAKGNYEKANVYYNSVFWGNLIICAVLIIPSIILIVFFEVFFDVPPDILLDVKILFSFVFFGFFLQTGAPNYEAGCYVSNRLDRTYIPQAILTVFRSAIIIGLFVIFAPHVWYVGLASFFVTTSMLIINKLNTKKLTPELKVTLKPGNVICSKSAIKDLVGSGIWNSISNMGNILLSGLDLVVCNALLGATAMGVLSVSKIFIIYMQQLSASFTQSFAPELTIDFALGNKENLKSNLNRSMKITGCILSIATAGMIVFGKSFFELWVPTQDANILSKLAILSFLGYIFTSGTQILYNVFQVTNHVKENSIAMIISGVVSILITILLVKFTNLGLYAIAGTSTICNFIRNMFFTLPATAKYLGYKWNSFYHMCLRTFISTLVVGLISFGVIQLIHISSWKIFIIDVVIVCVIGLLINIMIMLSKSDREYLFSKIKKVFHR